MSETHETAILESLKEWHVYGPPGTGKTHYLAHSAETAARKYGAGNVFISSFTKAAAKEIASRVDTIPAQNVGTLHSFCYRALGSGKVANKLVGEFNKDFPRWRLTPEKATLDDPYADRSGKSLGDEMMVKMERLRAQMIAVEFWQSGVRSFHKDWTTWKERNDLIDFTDMIEIALRDVIAAPGLPAVGFIDECQDNVKLECALLRKWSKEMEQIVLVGDSDQCIYRFRGATPDAMLGVSILPERKRVLSQSYRVPRAVHAVAEKWIKRLHHREPKEYRPRDADGCVRRLSAGKNAAEVLVRDAEKYLANGQTVMFLASCAFLLEPIKAVLRKQAIPFHNPYRRARGDWNPLQPGGKSKANPVDRVLAFMKPDVLTWGVTNNHWSWHDVYLWGSCMKAKGDHAALQTGAKAFLDGKKGDHTMFEPMELLSYVDPAARGGLEMISFHDNEAIRGALSWWLKHCLPDRQKSLAFAAAVAGKHGGQRLLEEPNVLIGTVHSVKGGEADHVYLLPDLSPAGMREWCGPAEERDSVRRMLYVGMTRSRETLILCDPSSGNSVSWN